VRSPRIRKEEQVGGRKECEESRHLSKDEKSEKELKKAEYVSKNFNSRERVKGGD